MCLFLFVWLPVIILENIFVSAATCVKQMNAFYAICIKYISILFNYSLVNNLHLHVLS